MVLEHNLKKEFHGSLSFFEKWPLEIYFRLSVFSKYLTDLKTFKKEPEAKLTVELDVRGRTNVIIMCTCRTFEIITHSKLTAGFVLII